MKKLIYGMSFPRKKVLKRLESYSDPLNIHVIGCVVYRDVLPDTLHHWYSEIATWLSAANNLKCDSKLKEKDYIVSLFGEFGEDSNDAMSNLYVYKAHNVRSHEYPDFEVTDDLSNLLYSIYQLIIELSLPILCSSRKYNTSEWLSLVTSELDKILR